MGEIVDLNEFANGAFAERFNTELQKVLQNIADPNTDPKKKRKLTVTVTLSADEARDVVQTGIVVKPTLAPAKDMESKIILDFDDYGRATGAELKSGVKGQTYLDYENESLKDDRGENVYEFTQDKGEVIND